MSNEKLEYFDEIAPFGEKQQRAILKKMREKNSVHEVKCFSDHFQDVIMGIKKFEIRRNDRNYEVGNKLIIQEFIPNFDEDGCLLLDENGSSVGKLTGRAYMTKIIYKMDGGKFGLEPGYCVLGIS